MIKKRQIIQTTWNINNKDLYESKGYIFTKMRDILNVKVEDLSPSSSCRIIVICDYCNKEYSTELGNRNSALDRSLVKKDCCKECRYLKTKECNLIRYGVEHTSMRKCFKEKMKEVHTFSEPFVKKYFSGHHCILFDKYIDCYTKMKYICLKHYDKGIQETTFANAYHKKNSNEICRYCGYETISGENHYNWCETLSKEDRETKRRNPKYYKWRKEVLKRDNHKCVCCGSSKDLCVHHMDGYSEFPNKRYNVDNGATLCRKCHVKYHMLFGMKNITKSRFLLFLEDEGVNIAI